jgi:SRSO17 transposase
MRILDERAGGREHHAGTVATKIATTPPTAPVELTQELVAQGFRFSVVLADSLYGASWDFTHALHRLGLQYVVAIRSNHIVWTFPGERVRQTRLSPLRAHLHRWDERAALHLRVRLWHTWGHPLLRGHHGSRPLAP